jgi:predicted ATP-grasp superfamily ATP-dependent carboligase
MEIVCTTGGGMRIFVTDADYKHTLAAIRSLGRKGHYIIVGSSSHSALSFHSRFCNERLIYPHPQNEQRFIEFLLEYGREHPIDVILPVGYYANVAISRNYKVLKEIAEIPVADPNAMGIALDKKKSMEFAGDHGVLVPHSYSAPEDIQNFPVVVKRIFGSGNVRYINSPMEFSDIDLKDAIIQEYIPGEGYGFFALCNRGSVRAFFMHKRLREYPITGGASTSAIGIYDPVLKNIGERLLAQLNWHGLAMIEFKKDCRNGKYKLMEINPKLWGSLDLSIASGVDFPDLAVRMAHEGDIPPLDHYKNGITFIWPFPDEILHILANPRSIPHVLGDIFRRRAQTNLRRDDIRPNLQQMISTPGMVLSRIKTKNLRYPYGKPVGYAEC